ncbi:MAG: glycosyltransferase family 4 protein, partial [Bacteroidia bacterium]
MKILQISHRVPYPLNEGGTIGIYNYTRGFAEAGVDVTLVCLNGIKHKINVKEAEHELKKYCKLYIFDIDTNVKPLAAFLNLFTNQSYNVCRFYNRTFELFLANLLDSEKFDIIQVEGTFVAMYHDVLRQHSQAPLVLRQHNVEYQIWERLEGNETNPLKKWYLNLLARRLKNFEKTFTDKFDAIVPVTQDDGTLFEKLGCTKPIFVSPAGINTSYWQPSDSENPFHIFHLGSLEWTPNLEAVLWFIKEVWPLLLKIDTRFKLFIAGKNMPDIMKQLKTENVVMVGEVKDGADFIKDKAITVVPLLSGSGIRLKILEAMAASKLVISTTIGAQGIEYVNGKHLLIADTPEEFVSLFKKIAENPECYDEVKKEGFELIKSKYA